jgi:hypothetical protein
MQEATSAAASQGRHHEQHDEHHERDEDQQSEHGTSQWAPVDWCRSADRPEGPLLSRVQSTEGPPCSVSTKAFSGFAVDDLGKAEQFYAETLGWRSPRRTGC